MSTGGVVAFHVPANVYYTVLLHDRRVVPRVVAPYREYLPVTRYTQFLLVPIK